MAHDPVAASELGDRRWNDQWENLSLDSLHETLPARPRDAHTLARHRPRPTSPQDQVSYDVFEYNTNDYLEGEQYKWYLVRTDTFDGIQTVEEVVNSLRFETVKDYDDWLGRMHNFPAYMDQNIGLMREGIKDHMVLPKVIGEKILAQFNGMDWQDPNQARILQAISKNAGGILGSRQAATDRSRQQTIKTDVLPAFQRFRDFMQKEYLPASFEQVGAWQVPNGDATYAYLARSRTTTNFTPATDPRDRLAGGKTHRRGNG